MTTTEPRNRTYHQVIISHHPNHSTNDHGNHQGTRNRQRLDKLSNSSRHILHSQLHYGRVSQHDSRPEAILFNSNRSSEHNMYSHNNARHLFSTYRLWENTSSSHNPSDFHPHFKRTHQHQYAQHPPKHQIQPGRSYFPQTLSYPNSDRNRTNATFSIGQHNISTSTDKDFILQDDTTRLDNNNRSLTASLQANAVIWRTIKKTSPNSGISKKCQTNLIIPTKKRSAKNTSANMFQRKTIPLMQYQKDCYQPNSQTKGFDKQDPHG